MCVVASQTPMLRIKLHYFPCGSTTPSQTCVHIIPQSGSSYKTLYTIINSLTHNVKIRRDKTLPCFSPLLTFFYAILCMFVFRDLVCAQSFKHVYVIRYCIHSYSNHCMVKTSDLIYLNSDLLCIPVSTLQRLFNIKHRLLLY